MIEKINMIKINENNMRNKFDIPMIYNYFYRNVIDMTRLRSLQMNNSGIITIKK